MRSHAEDIMRGLLSDLDRKSVEPMAERAGKDRRGMQRFIGSGGWAPSPVTGELCHQVGEELGLPAGVLVLDPTDFIKKGKNSVGVARQYCGRTGQVENCQRGVFLGYVTEKGRTLVDARLFLSEAWVRDRDRLAKCHVPPGIRHQSLCELGDEMLKAHGKSLPHCWVSGDDDFGRNADLRAELHSRGERYVLDIPSNFAVCEAQQAREATHANKLFWQQVRRWKDTFAPTEWTRVVVRDGAKGPLVVDATRRRVRARWRRRPAPMEEWLLVLREQGSKDEYRYCLSDADENVSLEEMVRAAASRYWIEDCFERAKGEVGLGDYETRSWDGWYHHMTLSLLALWFLVKEQRRLKESTPAMTLQQTKDAMSELLRNPELDAQTLADRITRRLKRNEEARISHWKKVRRLPPRHT